MAVEKGDSRAGRVASALIESKTFSTEDLIELHQLLGSVMPDPQASDAVIVSENVHTIDAIDNEDGYGTAITISPYVTEEGKELWQLYIPPTQPLAFVTDEETPYDPLTNEIREPWGDTYWDTLQGAVTSLAIAAKHGDVIFNDGRVAS